MRYWLEERKEGDKDEALTASPAVSNTGAQAGHRLCVGRGEGRRASEYA